MEISSVTNNQDIPKMLQDIVKPAVVSDQAITEAPKSQDSKSADFATFMKKALGGDNKTAINEEELFSALMEQRLGKQNSDALNYFSTQKSSLMVSMARADGYVSVEDVAKEALKATVTAGKISEVDANTINAQAFYAAQLDDNKDALYDSRGGPNDPTIATAVTEEALSKAQAAIEGIDSGTVSVNERSLNVPSNVAPGSNNGITFGDLANDMVTSTKGSENGSSVSGAQSLDGQGGFVWKPESERDGNLVVILPKILAGDITRLELHKSLPPSDNTRIGEGRYDGDKNGGRPHFRFNEPGSDYGDNIYVVAYKRDGEQVTYSIDDGAKRHD